jgi:hypothetical protein
MKYRKPCAMVSMCSSFLFYLSLAHFSSCYSWTFVPKHNKERCLKGNNTSLGTYRQNILLLLFLYDLEKKQREERRNFIMSWTVSILAFLR